MDERAYIPVDPAPLPRYPAGKRELIFGTALLICSIFLWNSILYGGFHLGFALGTVTVILCSVWYFLSCGYRFDRYTGALAVFSLLIAAGFGWASAYLKLIMLLLLIFSVNLCFCLLTGRNRRDPGGLSSLLDAPRACFTFGFGSLSPAARGLNDARKNAGDFGKKGSAVLLGLVITVPVVAVMLMLLIRADAAFEGLMELLPETNWAEPLYSLLFGGFAGWVLYARGTGLRHKETSISQQRTSGGISSITVNILLLAVSLMYLVYLLSQLAYTGGFSGILPEGYTLSQYARRGFFEMAWLSSINLGLMCFTMGLVKKSEKGLRLTRMLCLFLGLVALFLIATASAKMLLYIGSYGLTRLRVATEIFMVWLAVTTVLVCIRLFRPGFPYMKAVVIAALLISTLTFWVDMDARIAEYNVSAYQSGRLESIDTHHLNSLGHSAVPYIARLLESDDPEVAGQADWILRNWHTDVQDFRDWSRAEANAARILEELGY